MEPSLRVLAVIGSLNRSSSTRAVVKYVAGQLQTLGCATDILDLLEEPLALFNPDYSREAEGFARLKARVEAADVYILGTPDYHGSISSALKNFLANEWKRGQRIKRGGGQISIPIQTEEENTRYGVDPADESSPGTLPKSAITYATVPRGSASTSPRIRANTLSEDPKKM